MEREVNMDKEQEYKVIREEQANEALVEKLKSFKEYISEDMTEWVQLIAVGGFVADVIKLIDWKKRINDWHDYWYNCRSSKNDIIEKIIDDIIEEIWTAIDYDLNAPYADELNAIWHNWNTDTDYMPEKKTVTDVSDAIIERMEVYHPGLIEAAKKYFFPDCDPDCKAESL